MGHLQPFEWSQLLRLKPGRLGQDLNGRVCGLTGGLFWALMRVLRV